jgi:hypothetical protein
MIHILHCRYIDGANGDAGVNADRHRASSWPAPPPPPFSCSHTMTENKLISLKAKSNFCRQNQDRNLNMVGSVFIRVGGMEWPGACVRNWRSGPVGSGANHPKLQEPQTQNFCGFFVWRRGAFHLFSSSSATLRFAAVMAGLCASILCLPI